jgi:S1-C subfamily serine protease
MKNLRFLIVGIAFLAMLSCQPFGPTLPTVTPVPPTEAPPTATPRAGETPSVGETPTPQPTPQPSAQQMRQNLLRATVLIVAMQNDEPIWSGSGTIISADGLILTNAHVVLGPDPADPAYQADAMAVAITVRSDQPPEFTYLAEVKAIDTQVDLAVIQIATDLNGQPVNPGELNLTYIPLGDSDVLELGDMLEILGYPGIGGETITFTEGVVSGFTRERGVEGRAWIKTDATVAGGNSGGLAANPDGQIVGIPTRAGYGGVEQFVDCRILADTNGDGVIDGNDNCIPVGGFINALRPINLARPLIEMARLGIAPKQPQEPTTPSGEARFSNLVFSPDVTENDQPTQIVSQMPSGATAIYAFWDYGGMADGMAWEARWYHDGQLVEDARIAGTWQGGERGNWWVSIYDDSGLSDGEYRVELYAGDEMLLEGTIPLGGAVSGPTITGLIFSDGVTSDDRPTNPTYLLPSGISRVYAFFDYDGMEDGWAWGHTWYYEGEEIASSPGTWVGGASGPAWVNLSRHEADTPLDPGTYRLEISVEDALVAASNFTVAGAEGQQAIGPIAFASGVDAQDNPINPATSFPTGLEELHFFCDYTGMQDGLNLDETWLLDGEELVTFDMVWEWGEDGTYHDSIYRTGGDPLPDGAYTLELYLEGQLVQSGSTTVGTGVGRPTPTPPPTEGLYVVGTIRDADTGQGIPGAVYVVLNPGIRVDEWDGSEEDIYTWAGADDDGYFELPLPLERNQSYSMFAWAEGYTAVTGDDILVSDEPSPYEIEVTLQRE